MLRIPYGQSSLSLCGDMFQKITHIQLHRSLVIVTFPGESEEMSAVFEKWKKYAEGFILKMCQINRR